MVAPHASGCRSSWPTSGSGSGSENPQTFPTEFDFVLNAPHRASDLAAEMAALLAARGHSTDPETISESLRVAFCLHDIQLHRTLSVLRERLYPTSESAVLSE